MPNHDDLWTPPGPARRERRHPTALSREEVVRLLDSIRNPKHRLACTIAYSAGLRIGEVVRLRVHDVSTSRGLIRVRLAKGHQDRYTLLSDSVRPLLRDYLSTYQPSRWLFPGDPPTRPLSIRSVQKAVNRARKRAGISRPVSVHIFRTASPLTCPDRWANRSREVLCG